MKNILTLTILLSALALSAQTEGVVVYEESRKTTFKVPPQYADMIPKEVQNEMLLIFNEKESIYKSAPIDESLALNPQATRMEKMKIRFSRRRAGSIVYQNLVEKETINKVSFMGRDFIIKGADESIKWKMKPEQRKIADYTCMKATYMKNDTIPVTAWWTPQIPIADGPGNNGMLPGLVLALDENNGDVVIVAKQIDLRPLTDEETIEKPEKGKVMTREAFNKIRDEKMKEMKEMGGGRGHGMRRH